MFRRTASAACLRAGVYEIDTSQTKTSRFANENVDRDGHARVRDIGSVRAEERSEKSYCGSNTIRKRLQGNYSPLRKEKKDRLKVYSCSHGAYPITPGPEQQSPNPSSVILTLASAILAIFCMTSLAQYVVRDFSSTVETDPHRECPHVFKTGSLNTFTQHLHVQEDFDLERFDGDWYEVESFDLNRNNKNGYEEVGKLYRTAATSFRLMRIETVDSKEFGNDEANVSFINGSENDGSVKSGRISTCSTDRSHLIVRQSDGISQMVLPMMVISTDYNNYAVIFTLKRGIGNSSQGTVKFLSRYRRMSPLSRGKCWLEWHTRSGSQ